MKKLRIGLWLIAGGVVLWSIITDISTYNVYFTTDRPIVLYCIDGLIFNLPKIILPIVVAGFTYIYDFFLEDKIKKQEAEYENRANRC